jgi:inhibitor of KinA
MRIEPLGDSAVQIVLGDAPDEPTRRRVAAASRRLAESRLPGLTECVPGFTSLTIHYDPVQLPPVVGYGLAGLADAPSRRAG